jgi:hypothetical protein
METRLLGGHGSEFTIEMIFSAEVSRPLLMATSTTILILPWKKIVTVYARERFFIIRYTYIMQIKFPLSRVRRRLCL